MSDNNMIDNAANDSYAVSDDDLPTPICNEDTPNGPCGRSVVDGGPCYLHDPERGPPEDHGAQEGNVNAATHFFHVERKKLMDHIHPMEQALIWLWYEELLEQSVYDFDCKLKTTTIDFSDVIEDPDNDFPLPDTDLLDEDNKVVLDVPTPTEKYDQGAMLWCYAVDKLKMFILDSVLFEEGMTTEKVVDSVYDSDSDEWTTITKEEEHYLCLTYDRLLRTQKTFAEQGGLPRP